MEQRLEVRVYYEDTDCMGVVYHANYLKFLERARTEYMAALGTSVVEWAARGVIFPIYSVNIVFRAPARLGDRLAVISSAKRVSPFRVHFEQRIEREADARTIAEAGVDVVCTDLGGKLRDFPDSGIERAR
jgi:tol-pal system-associated acyl-CoA thioesterase